MGERFRNDRKQRRVRKERYCDHGFSRRDLDSERISYYLNRNMESMGVEMFGDLGLRLKMESEEQTDIERTCLKSELKEE